MVRVREWGWGFTDGRRLARGLRPTAAMCALALITTACGAGAGPGSSGHGGAPAASGQMAFATCMRAHGISDFPDPKGGGSNSTMQITRNRVQIDGVTLKETQAQFQPAQKACRNVAGASTQNAGGPPNAKLQQAALAFAQCMRAHGVPNFPDPKVGSTSVLITTKKGAGINPNSPTFKAAQTACGSTMLAARQAAKGGNG